MSITSFTLSRTGNLIDKTPEERVQLNNIRKSDGSQTKSIRFFNEGSISGKAAIAFNRAVEVEFQGQKKLLSKGSFEKFLEEANINTDGLKTTQDYQRAFDAAVALNAASEMKVVLPRKIATYRIKNLENKLKIERSARAVATRAVAENVVQPKSSLLKKAAIATAVVGTVALAFAAINHFANQQSDVFGDQTCGLDENTCGHDEAPGVFGRMQESVYSMGQQVGQGIVNMTEEAKNFFMTNEQPKCGLDEAPSTNSSLRCNLEDAPIMHRIHQSVSSMAQQASESLSNAMVAARESTANYFQKLFAPVLPKQPMCGLNEQVCGFDEAPVGNSTTTDAAIELAKKVVNLVCRKNEDPAKDTAMCGLEDPMGVCKA